jgi:hypothetical protein
MWQQISARIAFEAPQTVAFSHNASNRSSLSTFSLTMADGQTLCQNKLYRVPKPCSPKQSHGNPARTLLCRLRCLKTSVFSVPDPLRLVAAAKSRPWLWGVHLDNPYRAAPTNERFFHIPASRHKRACRVSAPRVLPCTSQRDAPSAIITW